MQPVRTRAREREPRDEAYYERVREALDEAMLANPVLSHIARESPISEKYKAGRLRLVK